MDSNTGCPFSNNCLEVHCEFTEQIRYTIPAINQIILKQTFTIYGLDWIYLGIYISTKKSNLLSLFPGLQHLKRITLIQAIFLILLALKKLKQRSYQEIHVCKEWTVVLHKHLKWKHQRSSPRRERSKHQDDETRYLPDGEEDEQLKISECSREKQWGDWQHLYVIEKEWMVEIITK